MRDKRAAAVYHSAGARYYLTMVGWFGRDVALQERAWTLAGSHDSANWYSYST
jgi:hypothetical protein